MDDLNADQNSGGMGRMHCKDCGKQIADDSKFCRFCGIRQASEAGQAEENDSQVELGTANSDDSNANLQWAAWGFGLFFLIVILVVIGSPDNPRENMSDETLTTNLSLFDDGTVAADMGNTAGEQESALPASNWAYSTDEDKVRGATTYFARTTSTNSVYQQPPYDSETRMSMVVRESRAQGTDVLMIISSGQMMCSSYEGCEGTVRFDDGPAERISFNGPADNSSETIFVVGAEEFISKLKKSKRVVVEKTLYQAGNPQFEFSVEGLTWEH